MKEHIDKMTIVRMLVLFLGLINYGLKATGREILPITDENINEVVSFAWLTAASLWAWWKNNSFTQSAIRADKYLKDLRRNN